MPRLNGDTKIVFHVLILQRGKVNTGSHTVKRRRIEENKLIQCLLGEKGVWILDQMNQEGHLPSRLNQMQTCKRKKYIYFIVSSKKNF